MNTTQAKAGRGGGVRTDNKAMVVMLRTMRKSLVSLARQLENELDKDFETGASLLTGDKSKLLLTILQSAHKAMQQINEIEGKLTGQTYKRIPDSPVINMDEARAEIERRLARLAA